MACFIRRWTYSTPADRSCMLAVGTSLITLRAGLCIVPRPVNDKSGLPLETTGTARTVNRCALPRPAQSRGLVGVPIGLPDELVALLCRHGIEQERDREI